jgi:dipeptidyl aminopeptidase/acylaminoacyl peptidase
MRCNRRLLLTASGSPIGAGDRYGQREHIWTIPVSGGEPVAVTDGSSTDLNPVWSPDGKYLYFSSNRGGSSNIWRVLIDEDTGVLTGAPGSRHFNRCD